MSARPHVLYACFDAVPAPKGAATHVTYCLEALRAEYEATLFSLGEPGMGMYAGARHLVPAIRTEHYLERALAYREALWDELETTPYDLVHFRTAWAGEPVAALKAAQGVRVIYEVNGVESIELPYAYPALRSRPELLQKLRAQEADAFAAADLLVTPSAVTGRYLARRGVDPARIRVIPNGVDPALFSPAPHPQGRRGACAPGGAGPLRLLYLGTVSPWQGVDLLLAAVRRARAEVPLRLTVVSSGPRARLAALRKQAVKWGMGEVVDFLPAVPHAETPALIRAADICVAPLTYTERNMVQGCCPLKILEYLACGKAVIAADLPVTREILTHARDALLCKMDKPSRLAACLVSLAGDPDLRARLGMAAAETARHYSWARAQAALREVYASLLPASVA